MIIIHKHAKYLKDKASLVTMSTYGVDASQTAILLIDPNTGERNATATICIPDEVNSAFRDMYKDIDPTVWIKDYSENEGIYQDLVDNGVISEMINEWDLPHGNTAKFCKLLKPEL